MAHQPSFFDKIVNKILGGKTEHKAIVGVPIPHAHVPNALKNIQKKFLKWFDLAQWASPVPPPDAPENGVMFGCIPLRTGTFSFAFMVGLVSWFFLFFRSTFFTYMRWFVGGYDMYSKIMLSCAIVPG